MMRWIVASSLRFRFLVVAAAASMLFFGIGQVSNTPLDVFPEFAPPRVEIQTPCMGLSAEEVESLVSVPMEQALNGIEGLEIMRSRSIPDLSAIELLFKPGTDILRARQLAQERIATVLPTLPTWAAPPVMMPPISTTGRVMKIGLSSQEVGLNDLSMIAYWTIRARLLRVPGVANVPIWGERIKMQQVQVDATRMAAHKVSLEQVMDVTSTALDSGLLKFSTGSVIGTGGFFETPNQRLSIRHISPITTPADLGRVPIQNRLNEDGSRLTLNDVADVVEGTWPLFGDAVINDGPGLLLVVEKYPWANTLDVTRGVQKALNELQPGLPGITVDPLIFRPADFIQMALDNLTRSLIFGCLFVVLVLSIFLFEWRTALISLAAIPLSLIAGALVLYARGASINTMVLAGFVIAVGVVVDDAIIDVENIVRRLRQHRLSGSSKSTAHVILEASLEVRSSIVYATLIIVAAIMPVFFIGGVSGAFFEPLALSYGVAVLASMLVALTVTPALCLILLTTAPIERRRSPLVLWLQQAYGRALSPIVRTPRLAYVAVGVISIVGLTVAPMLGQSLFPAFKERDFLVHLITKPGTPLDEERRIVTNAGREIRAVPGVQDFGAHIGQALLADEISGVNFGEGWISVNPTVDYDTTVAAIREVVDSYPGMFHNVLTYLNERIDEVLSGEGHALVVRVYGPDLKGIRAKAVEIQESLASVEGIVDLHVELQEEIPQVQVEVKLEEAQRYGLKPGDVRRAAATLLHGEEVGDIFRQGKAYDVNVYSTPATRANLSSIQDLLLDTPGGGRVRMGDVADIHIVPASNLIQRENDSRRIDVGADVRGRDIGAVAHDVEERLHTISYPLGYHAEVLGEYAERQAAQGRLLGFALAAAVGVFLLLVASFSNWRLAALSFVTLPSALVGGVLAAYLGGGILSLGSLVGFLTVFGIAARNGILLINHYQHLEQFEDETFGAALVLRGARERLSPILMTALATGLALVPLVIAGDIPGHEIEHPMAIVILGGLVTSTLLNLFVVPAIYLRFGRNPRRSHEGLRLMSNQQRERSPRRPIAVSLFRRYPRLLLPLLSVAIALVPLVASAQAAPPQPAPAQGDCAFNPSLDPTAFSHSTRIDNKWLPLAPGSQFTLEGRASRDNRPLPHKVIFTVTDLVKVINGVKSVVLWDVDVQDGKTAEAELAFHAQDDQGNVWMLGEYPEEYSPSGKFVGAAKTWMVGLNQTRAGWGMIADPKLGGPRYLQASSPPIGFLDCAQVFAVEQRACVPVACYDQVLITDETSPISSTRAHQRKYYAPGVGNVQISAVDDPESETLVLTSLQRLGPAALAHARGEALKLEKHAYAVNDIYRRTSPMELPPGVTLADSLAHATSVTGEGGPILHVGNPNKGDMIIPGSLIMSGVAFDDNAETGLGVDRVSVFLGDRDVGGKHLGDAHLGGHNVVTDDPQFADGGWKLLTPPLKGAGRQDELFVYARSTVNGLETVVNIPITVGDHVNPSGPGAAEEE